MVVVVQAVAGQGNTNGEEGMLTLTSIADAIHGCGKSSSASGSERGAVSCATSGANFLTRRSEGKASGQTVATSSAFVGNT